MHQICAQNRSLSLEDAALRRLRQGFVEAVARVFDRGDGRLREGPLAAGRKPRVATDPGQAVLALAEDTVLFDALSLKRPVILFPIAAAVEDHHFRKLSQHVVEVLENLRHERGIAA